nr:immunoglobulin heavy chain junction region [Mus musculus]
CARLRDGYYGYFDVW